MPARCICIAQANCCHLEKKSFIKVQNSTSQRNIERFNKKVLNNSLFGFAQVDIEVPEELKDRFS